MEGFLEVIRIPGNFHVAHHAFSDILGALHAEGIELDNSFKINHLSFGDLKDKQAIAERFPDTDIRNPLDGFEREKGDAKNMRVGFFLNAVPSEFEADHALGNTFVTEAFQLTASYETDYTYAEDLIIFNYQISPIAIHYTNSKENIFQFLINICAIIGGIFTVAGIVDSLIHKGSKIVFKG